MRGTFLLVGVCAIGMYLAVILIPRPHTIEFEIGGKTYTVEAAK